MMIAARPPWAAREEPAPADLQRGKDDIPSVASEATGVRTPADSFSEPPEGSSRPACPGRSRRRIGRPWATDSWSRSMLYQCLVATSGHHPRIESTDEQHEGDDDGEDTDTSAAIDMQTAGRTNQARSTDLMHCKVEQDGADETAPIAEERAPPILRTGRPRGSRRGPPVPTATSPGWISQAAGPATRFLFQHSRVGGKYSHSSSSPMTTSVGGTRQGTRSRPPARKTVASRPSLKIATDRNGPRSRSRSPPRAAPPRCRSRPVPRTAPQRRAASGTDFSSWRCLERAEGHYMITDHGRHRGRFLPRGHQRCLRSRGPWARSSRRPRCPRSRPP